MRPTLTRIVPTLCASIVLASGIMISSSDAQACECSVPDITQSYNQAESVFTGQVLFGFDLPTRKLVLVWVHETYKGCAPKNPILWVETNLSEPGCGPRYHPGSDYLIHSTQQGGPFSFAKSTNACAGNRSLDRLSPKDRNFLNSRTNCCGDECSCTGGQELVNCLADPCEVTTPCEQSNPVRCEPNYCGGCFAEFYDKDDKQVCREPLNPVACTRDEDCDASQYCGFNGVCEEDTTCNFNGECDLEGNEYDVFIDCDGYGVCGEQKQCDFYCGDPSCADHTGYDFGDCEMVVGWVRKGEECVFIDSGCGSLISNRKPFASKQDCETRCVLEPTTFACGKELHCDAATSFCLESTPGMEPPPGAPTQYFDCEPLPSNCADSPSCETCFNIDENSMIVEGELATGTCTRSEDGFITVDIAYP